MADKLQVRQMASSRLPLMEAEFRIHLYTSTRDEKDQLALVLGEVEGGQDVLVRVHSECLTGDVFGSERCDCGDQLKRSISDIAAAGRGVLIYLRQEGRGIGLLEKLRAYNLQDEGYDTVEANLMLGHQPDERDYSIAAAILEDLGIRSIKLLTNNPRKVDGLTELGMRVTERVPLMGAITSENALYLQTKRYRLNHYLQLNPAPETNGAHPIRHRTNDRSS